MNVELYDFVAIVTARIGHVAGYLHDGGLIGCRCCRLRERNDAEVLVTERRVAEAMAKRVERLCRHLDVVVWFWGSLVVVHGQLPYAGRHRYGQSAGWIVVAHEHIGDGCASRLTRIVGRKQCIGIVGSPRLVERSAFDVDHHEGFAR